MDTLINDIMEELNVVVNEEGEETLTNKRTRRGWTKGDIERMIASNTKLVDECKALKRDLFMLVGYFTGTSVVEKEIIDQILAYYKDKRLSDIGGMKGELRDEEESDRN